MRSGGRWIVIRRDHSHAERRAVDRSCCKACVTILWEVLSTDVSRGQSLAVHIRRVLELFRGAGLVVRASLCSSAVRRSAKFITPGRSEYVKHSVRRCRRRESGIQVLVREFIGYKTRTSHFPRTLPTRTGAPPGPPTLPSSPPRRRAGGGSPTSRVASNS